MGVKKVYRCCICHKVLNDYKPHRLVWQEYEYKGYGLYRNQYNYDFCTHCFSTFKNWVKKYEEGGRK